MTRCFSTPAASPRRTGPVSASGRPIRSTFSATERSSGPSMAGMAAGLAPAFAEQIGAGRGERRRPVGHEPRRRVVGDAVERGERARVRPTLRQSRRARRTASAIASHVGVTSLSTSGAAPGSANEIIGCICATPGAHRAQRREHLGVERARAVHGDGRAAPGCPTWRAPAPCGPSAPSRAARITTIAARSRRGWSARHVPPDRRWRRARPRRAATLPEPTPRWRP